MNNLYREYGLLWTMKRVAICAALVFVSVNAHAQSDFEELAKIKGVEYVQVNKDMIKLAGMEGNKSFHVRRERQH